MQNTEPKDFDITNVPSYVKELGTRISVVAEAVGDRKAAASVAGISSDSLQRYIRGEVQPPFVVLVRLCLATNYSLKWLATEEGPMLDVVTADFPIEHQTLSKRAKIELVDSDFSLIDFYDIEASAGSGSLVDQELKINEMAFRKDWLQQRGLESKKCALLKARGDSMEPTIHDGDLLLVDTRVDSIKDDAIYIVQADHHLIVKRIQQGLDGSLIIISDNLRYEKQKISSELAKEVKIAGRVRWYGHEI